MVAAVASKNSPLEELVTAVLTAVQAEMKKLLSWVGFRFQCANLLMVTVCTSWKPAKDYYIYSGITKMLIICFSPLLKLTQHMTAMQVARGLLWHCPHALCVVGRAHPSSSQLFGSTRQQDPSRPHPPQGLCQHVEGQPPCPTAWGGSQACPRLQPKRSHPTKSGVQIPSGWGIKTAGSSGPCL